MTERPDERQEQERPQEQEQERRGQGGGAADQGTRPRIAATDAAHRAVEQLGDLLGNEPERVIGVTGRDGGWRVRLEVVELERIPSTSSLLGSYDVDLDEHGELVGYRRAERYTRGQIREAER